MVSPIDLVIFDCDGVLVDSESLAAEVLVDVIQRVGGNLDASDVYRLFLGKSKDYEARVLREDFGLPISADDLRAGERSLLNRFPLELRPIPGVAKALDELSRTVCVASSSSPGRIRLSLEVTGLAHHFEPHLFSSAQVEQGKPAPDLFLFAARTMGVPPTRCLVIEDSEAGVLAAQAAGMRVAGFAGGSHARPAGLCERLLALKPQRLFDRMDLLPGIVTDLAGPTFI